MARTFGGRPTLGQMTRQPWGGVKPVGGGFDTQAPFSQAPETQGPFGVRAGDSQGPEWPPAPSFAMPDSQGQNWGQAPQMQGGGWGVPQGFLQNPETQSFLQNYGQQMQAPFTQEPETQGAGWGAPPTVDPWAIQQAVNVGPMSFGGNRATLARLARGGR